MRFAAAFSIAALAFTSAPFAIADESINALRGHLFAHHVCGQCHAVDGGDYVSPNPAAPPFASVMSDRDNTDMVLLVWLHTPHKSMPEIRVESDDLQDLIAYLETLRPARSKSGER